MYPTGMAGPIINNTLYHGVGHTVEVSDPLPLNGWAYFCLVQANSMASGISCGARHRELVPEHDIRNQFRRRSSEISSGA